MSARDMATLRTRVGPTSIKMELVTMIPELPGVMSRVVEALQEKIVQGLPKQEELKNAQTAIEDMFENLETTVECNNDSATVHAEAALMGVVYAIAGGEEMPPWAMKQYLCVVGIARALS